MKPTDIVIIGAGPAGCSTSLFLAKNKIPHTIIDKAIFPRDKVCGDALSGKVVYVMKQLNPEMINDYNNNSNQFMPSWGVKFVAPNGKSIDIPFKSDVSKETHAPGFISKRIDFDASLFNKLDKNYANVLDGTELLDVIKTDDGITIQLKNKTESFEIKNIKMLIGAEGDRSLVAKKLSDIKKENDHYCAGIRAYYEGVTELHDQNFIELHFLEELLPGYFWIFPLPNGQANVGAGMLSSSVSAKKVNLKEDMLRAIANNPKIKHRFANAKLVNNIQGWGLPLGSKKGLLVAIIFY